MQKTYGRIVVPRKTTTNKNKQITTTKLINSVLRNLLCVLPTKWSPLGLGHEGKRYHVLAFFPGSLFVTVVAVVGFCVAIRAKKSVINKQINKQNPNKQNGGLTAPPCCQNHHHSITAVPRAWRSGQAGTITRNLKEKMGFFLEIFCCCCCCYYLKNKNKKN